MNTEVIVTCAVTGAGDTVGRHPAIPVTPKQIADSAIEAAKAGAAICHIHVRDPETGKGAAILKLYREVVERVRTSGVDMVVNLTAGMGGDFDIGADEEPIEVRSRHRHGRPAERLVHVEELLPEICTLDCGTLNFGDGDLIYISHAEQLRAGAKRIRELGREAGARGVRHRPSLVRQADAEGRPAGRRRRCSSSASAFPGARRPTPPP